MGNRVRSTVFIIPILLMAWASPAVYSQTGKPVFSSAGEARKTFADLLKIPVEPPLVSVTVRSTTEEENLIIEDIDWESPDNQHPPAFVIRPAKANMPLPAIVCLDGTGGSREATCTRFFGEGEWTTPGDSKPHKRLLGWARELSRRGYLTLSLTQRGLDIRKPDTNDQAKDLLVRAHVDGSDCQ